MSTPNPLFNGGKLPAPSDDPAGPELFEAPAAKAERPHGHDEAASIIRSKLERLYKHEPSAKAVRQEVQADKPRSKHQQYMQDLSNSGRSLAEIQAAWHHYYEQLPNDEKHAVWQEFYSTQHQQKAAQAPAETVRPQPVQQAEVSHNPLTGAYAALPAVESTDKRSADRIHEAIRGKARNAAARQKISMKHHVQAVAFGLAVGCLALLITLFGFFNEVVIAPFIQPSRSAGATPIIIGTGSTVASGEPKVIIPKINVEIPLDFGAKTTDDATMEEALDRGVAHYPTTALPGQLGNASFFGHSSNNLFNKGKYKFAFVLLHQLVPGDTFYLTYGGTAYAYQVFDKKVVPPTQLSILDPVEGQPAVATLVTCDPPGTSLNRLVIWGKQVSPDPAQNAESGQQSVAQAAQEQQQADTDDSKLPGNGPTLWGRIIDWFSNLFNF